MSTRRITDDELARRIVEVLEDEGEKTMADLWLDEFVPDEVDQSDVRHVLRALRDEGRVVEVAGPRGSLWRLP